MLDAPRLRDHWWPRPGWRPGRRMYTWHLTFEHTDALHEHTRRYQSALTGPHLHLVPPEWLHLTVQALGYADEITHTERDAAVDGVAAALRAVPPFTLSFGRPVVRSEAVAMHPTPAEPVHELWATIRAGIADALGGNAVPTGPEQTDGFRPHVSIAYSRADQDAASVIAALDEAHGHIGAVRVPVTAVSLIEQERLLAPHWLYRWTTVATTTLTG